MTLDPTGGHIRAFYNTTTDERSAVLQLSFMRNLSKQAFEHLCRTDTKCASIAVRRGWMRDDKNDPQMGWGNRQAVADAIRRVRKPMPDCALVTAAALAAIKSALNRHAPENLDLLDHAP